MIESETEKGACVCTRVEEDVWGHSHRKPVGSMRSQSPQHRQYDSPPCSVW